MAKKKTTMEVNVKGTGIKSTAKDVKRTRKETEKLDKSQENLSGSTNRYHKLQKGVAQAGANSTKNFSKMNQTLGGSGGSSGLVAAYATLAANVFAATAAFNALQRAAEFQQLEKGLHELGHQSGRTLSILADGLRDVTGGALSAEEAMRGAALGISGGFGGAELEGLAKIAKGAAITLGRNLPDAFDRLTRGAIKLEPEILDELGIMVRVDDAAENYAATIGKTASSLTQMEKRQAFMNEILEQGKSKFGEIAEAVDPDPYTKLGATFADLTKDIFTFINETLMLGDIVSFLAENVTVLAGVMLLFGSTIASKMLPFLADGAAAAHAQAQKMAALAEATLNAGKAQQALAVGQLGTAGGEGLSKAYIEGAAAAKEHGADIKDLQKLQKSLNGSLGHYSSKIKMGKDLNSTANKQRLVGLELEKQKLAQIIAMEQGRSVDMLKFNKLQASSLFADDAAIAINNYTSGVQGLGDSFGDINKGFGTYVKNVDAAKEALLENGATLTLSQKLMTRLGGVTQWLGKQFRLLGAAVLKAIVPIALIIITIGVAIALWNKFYNTKEQQAYKKGMDELQQLIGEIEEKVGKMNAAMNNTKDLADGQVRAFEIQSGLISELISKQRQLIKLRELADKSRPGGKGTDIGLSEGDAKHFDIWGGTGPGSANAAFLGTNQAIPNIKDALQIKDSAEWQTTVALLESELPGVAQAMTRKMNKILNEGMGEQTPREFAANFGKANREIEAMFGNLGPAATGLRQSLKELEKESSKFLTTFGQKTSVDAFVKSFESVDKALAEFKETVKSDAEFKHWAESIGKTLLDVGGKTAMLMGPEFMKQQDYVRDLTKQLDQYTIKTGKSLEELREEGGHGIVELLDEQLVLLGEHSERYSELSSDVKEIQQLERMRKTTNAALTKMQKTVNKLAKAGLDIGKKQFQIEARRLKNEQILRKLKFALISKEFQHIKVMQEKTISANNSVFAGLKYKEEVQIPLEEFMTKSWAEQNALADANNIKTDALTNLRAAAYDIAVRDLEIQKASKGAIEEASKAKAEAQKKELEAAKKLLDIRKEITEIELRLQNYMTRGNTDLDAGQEAKLKVDAAIADFEFAKDKMEAEKAIIKAKGALQKLDLEIINKQIDLTNKQTRNLISAQTGLSGDALTAKITTDPKYKDSMIDKIGPERVKAIEGAIDKMTQAQEDAIEADAKLLGLKVELAISEGLINIKNAIESGDLDIGEAIVNQMYIAAKRGTGITAPEIPTEESEEEKIAREEKAKKDKRNMQRADRMQIASGFMAQFKHDLAEISEEGAGMSQFIGGMDMMAQSVVNFANGANKIQAVQGILSGIGQAIAGASKAQAAEVQQQIDLEEKRDGKSKESLAKIQALKMKKYQIEKKAFEQNKKIQLANAVITGLSAINSGFATQPFFPMGLAMGAMATAMTMMQIKAIRNTQFGGTPPNPGDASAAKNSLTIGKQGSSVDVSRGASSGELGYLRGQRGYGRSGAMDYTTTGGAAGMRRVGYSTGSTAPVLVGEQGPEVLQPRGSYDIIPNDALGGATNVNFTINAVDAAGVEDVITRQQGHIINLLRSAANDNGEEFLEQVDTQVLR